MKKRKKEVNPLHIILILFISLIIIFSLTPLKEFITGNIAFRYSDCVDPDGGRNYYGKSTVKDSLGEEYTDYCKESVNQSKFIVEYSCGNYGKAYGFVAYCEHGCEDGACLLVG